MTTTSKIKRLLAMARFIKIKAMLSLSYGCGLRAGEARAGPANLDSSLSGFSA